MVVSHQVNTFYEWNGGWHWKVHIYGVYFWLASIIRLMMMMMMMMMMNYFCCMVDQRKAFSLNSSRGHCQRSSPSQISNTMWAGFEPVQSMNSSFVEWSCTVVMTTTPHYAHIIKEKQKSSLLKLSFLVAKKTSQNLNISCTFYVSMMKLCLSSNLKIIWTKNNFGMPYMSLKVNIQW